MANDFLSITKQALKMHGMLGKYTRVSAGVYNVETGTKTDTTTEHSVQMYKKHIKASQYHYPDLIGTDSALFYVASDSLSFVPSIKDKITYNSEQYKIVSYAEHIALGQVVLYKILATKA
jgi:hypothetical protein